jgi:hypothetical protein
MRCVSHPEALPLAACYMLAMQALTAQCYNAGSMIADSVHETSLFWDTSPIKVAAFRAPSRARDDTFSWIRGKTLHNEGEEPQKVSLA